MTNLHQNLQLLDQGGCLSILEDLEFQKSFESRNNRKDHSHRKSHPLSNQEGLSLDNKYDRKRKELSKGHQAV